MSQPIIQIQHLNKTFGTGPTAVHALEDINLEIEAGEIFGIIGLSGAGKSTLVRCMNLLERPTTGSVLVDGKDLTKLRDKQLRQARQDISMIFQSFNLLRQRTALDNICFPLELIGTKRADAVKRARELLELVQKCQNMGVEPFGFGKKAVRQFLTFEDWNNYHWRDRFAQADVGISVDIEPIDAA